MKKFRDRIFFIGLYVYITVIGLMAFYQIRISQAATIQLCMTFVLSVLGVLVDKVPYVMLIIAAMIWMIFMVPVSQIQPPLGNDRAAARLARYNE